MIGPPFAHNSLKIAYYFLKIALPPSGMGLECTTEQTEKVQRPEDEKQVRGGGERVIEV